MSDLAKIAYRAYATSTGGKTFDGRDMPDWDDLGDRVQAAWTAAAEAVRVAVAPVVTWTSPTPAVASGPALSPIVSYTLGGTTT